MTSITQEFLSVEEVAKELRLKKAYVRNLISYGRLDSFKLGAGRLITREAVDDYKTKRRGPGRPRTRPTS